MLLTVVGLTGLLGGQPAAAKKAAVIDTPSGLEHTQGPPRSAWGWGVGLPLPLPHLDYRRWVSQRLSIDLSVSPWLFANLAHAGLTVHLPLASSATSEKSLIFSGNAGAALLLCCGSGSGPGIEIGYAELSPQTNRGVSYTARALFIEMFGAPRGLYEVRVTWWRVSR